jgi:hypothetical protein
MTITTPTPNRLAMHQEKASKRAAKDEEAAPGAVPAYLIDREGVNRAKARPYIHIYTYIYIVHACFERCIWTDRRADSSSISIYTYNRCCPTR